MKTFIRDILLVDDSANDVTLIKHALAEANIGNEVVVAEDGEEAIDFINRRGKFEGYGGGLPIFILLDIKMPLMDGIEVLKLIRQIAEYNLVPIIMLTSSRDTQDLQACYDSGANSFVVKPVNMSSFIQVVRDLGKYWVIINELPS
ncbi:MAG: response regulator [Prolixibacteraceae bacterium]